MRYIFISFVALIIIVSSGCSTVTHSTSYAIVMSSQDAAVIASSISSFVVTQFPPASSTLAIFPLSKDNNNALREELYSDLGKKGYAISNPTTQQVEGAHTVRYLVSPLGTGILVRLQLDKMEVAGWFYKNKKGILQAESPFTVRK